MKKAKCQGRRKYAINSSLQESSISPKHFNLTILPFYLVDFMWKSITKSFLLIANVLGLCIFKKFCSKSPSKWRHRLVSYGNLQKNGKSFVWIFDSSQIGNCNVSMQNSVRQLRFSLHDFYGLMDVFELDSCGNGYVQWTGSVRPKIPKKWQQIAE